MTSFRIERDTMGEVKVPEERYWGAQTGRAMENFPIGTGTFPSSLIHALGMIKVAAARANGDLGILQESSVSLIAAAASEVAEGKLDDHFPVPVWQSGSGTQLNMNANEVIANRACELAGRPLGSKDFIHPNDDVNRSQSSNDVIPTAIHLAVSLQIRDRLIPALVSLEDELEARSVEYANDITIGRTHLMDAVPLSLGQEISGWSALLQDARQRLTRELPELHALTLGGTAVGTGLNAPGEFADLAVRYLRELTDLELNLVSNRFAAQGSHDALVAASASLRGVSVALRKIAWDISLLGSGPRCGLGELFLPANEPGSSIMPGKVNPSQSEAMIMVCTQVMGYDTAVAIAGASGTLQINTFKPLIALNLLTSIDLLSDAAASFRERCVKGLRPNRPRLKSYLQASLMLVTALVPVIGYDRAAEIAKRAHEEGLTLREAAIASGEISEEEFDRRVRPETMI
ncbi:MAG TPA: class II fumarate hydratase [Thermoanaerobaculia bacterium]|nr:class II fumarate hydratase [Thermoanaerobaculia bacterium]HUM30609.1 class II fumarate hydratase [Thermoanaerobaculia bacterium]HXK68863.1 class II fumarate hydratase [Thermoanaerobaculia bacterium]